MLGLTPLRNDQIYLPNGTVLNVDESQAARAVDDYDSNLVLGQRPDTQEWVVFMRSGPEGQPFPVLGLGMVLPPYDVIRKKLYDADTHRHAGKIAERVDRANAEKIKQARQRSDQSAAEAAEYMEFAHRKLGGRNDSRIFVPDSKAV